MKLHSVALTHAWRLIDGLPDVRDALIDEYRDVVNGDRLNSEYDADRKRPQHVASETLRLSPSTLGVTRHATDTVTLDGHKFPAVTQFLCPQWPVHRNERFGDDPTAFDPSRWPNPRDHPEYAYFSFSGGSRKCVGMQFAKREAALVLAIMIGNSELVVSVDGPLTFTPSLQLRPEPDIDATVTLR